MTVRTDDDFIAYRLFLDDKRRGWWRVRLGTPPEWPAPKRKKGVTYQVWSISDDGRTVVASSTGPGNGQRPLVWRCR